MRTAGTLAQAGNMKTLECRIASINLASPPQHGRTAASSLPALAPRQRLPLRSHSLTRPLSLSPVRVAASAVAGAARSDAPSRRPLPFYRRRFPLLSREWQPYHSVGLAHRFRLLTGPKPELLKERKAKKKNCYSISIFFFGSTDSSSKSAPVQRFLDLVEQSGREWRSYGVAPGSRSAMASRSKALASSASAVATAVVGVGGGRRLMASTSPQSLRHDKPTPPSPEVSPVPSQTSNLKS
jgi:hypothetical protein